MNGSTMYGTSMFGIVSPRLRKKRPRLDPPPSGLATMRWWRSSISRAVTVSESEASRRTDGDCAARSPPGPSLTLGMTTRDSATLTPRSRTQSFARSLSKAIALASESDPVKAMPRRSIIRAVTTQEIAGGRLQVAGAGAPAISELPAANLIAAFVLLALTLAMTWPLAFAIDRAVIYPGDPFINTWITDWDWYATFHQPTHLFQANAFYPAKDSLAFSENLYGVALILFPLRAIGVAPLTAFNVGMLLGFFFSAFAAYVLGRMISGSWIAGIAAGIFYAFVPWRFTQLPHIQHVWGGWLPMMIAALLHYARTPSWRNAALFGGAFLMNGLTNIHWLLLGSLAIALSVPIAVRSPRDWIRIAVCTLIAFALRAPFLIPYARVAKLDGMERHWDEAKHYSATLRDWLNPGVTNRFYRRFADTKIDPELWLFPGAFGMALSIIGVTRGRRDHRAIALLWITLGIIGSLGLYAFLHKFLFAHVPGFRAIRVPARWANIAYAGMSMLIALAVSWIASKRRP